MSSSLSKLPLPVVAGAVLGVLPAAAQGQASTILSKPEVEFPEAFTSIKGVRELVDGRVLLLDFRERSVQLLDLRTGRGVQLGRNGKGPGEYALPVGLIPLAGGSFGIVDEATRRILVVLPDGRIGTTFRPQMPRSVAGDDWEAQLRESDELGRFYATGRVERTVNGVVTGNDSVPIIRWTPGQPRADTLTWIRLQATKVSSSRRGQAFSINIRVDPFVARDDWAVAPDGRVAVADPDNYQILWTDPNGRHRAGPSNPFIPLRFTEEHKREWLARQADGVAIVGGDDGEITMRPVRPPRRGEEYKNWPRVLPPFLGWALKFAPDGRLWVRRTVAAGAASAYDVIDAQGRVVQRVELPKDAKLLGFGANGAIYAMRSDADGLEYLQRYRLP